MKNETLNVFEIERFAIHDGPGIRTAVFLKGCPLKCEWCANPESQLSKPQLMHLQKKCGTCGRCATACPNGAVVSKDGPPSFDRERCKLCGSCVNACLNGALQISGTRMNIDDILAVVLRDRSYYDHSRGGVTVSGGEPFMQYNGFISLLEACKREGLHTAVETCADVDTSRFTAALEHIDLCLFDLKHHDGEKLRASTGANLERILRNLDEAAKDAQKVIIRVPVVPGFNFNEADMSGIFNIALTRGIKRVHLLPYHTLGSGKYEAIGREYPLKHLGMLKKEELEPLRVLGESLGIQVKVGG